MYKELFETVTDRSSDMVTVCNNMLDFWKSKIFTPDVQTFMVKGVKTNNPMDMSTFLYKLMEEGIIITIPSYHNTTTKVVKNINEQKVTEKIYGKILGLISNKDHFRFSLNIMDMSIMTQTSVGKPRTYSLTNPDGSRYGGWDRIDFTPTDSFKKYIIDGGFNDKNKIALNSFVSDGKWEYIYKPEYFATKLLIEELLLRYNHVKSNTTIDKNSNENEKFEKTDNTPNKEVVKCFCVETNSPEVTSPFTFDVTNNDNNKNLLSFYYKHMTDLRFFLRTVDFSFVKKLNEVSSYDNMPIPTNIKYTWEVDYILPSIKKVSKNTIRWNRLQLNDPNYEIRTRHYDKKIDVK